MSTRAPSAIPVLPLLLFSTLLGGCVDPGEPDLDEVDRALTTEDGLAEAFDVFSKQLIADGGDQRFVIGFGFHPGMVNTRVEVAKVTASGSAMLSFDEDRVTATLRSVPDDQRFDLWLVRNHDGVGLTVLPEAEDEMLRIGRFEPARSRNIHVLDVTLDPGMIEMPFDQVVVTPADELPQDRRVATGARTLLEKRFFRERAGGRLDAPTGEMLDSVETADRLIARGAQLFFHETFDGNGRTCGTCHPADNNLTIDPAFIATLPASDALFIAELDPALADLEDPRLLRHDALIRENVDGFENPTRKFVLRSVPHTLAMSTSMGRGDTFIFPSDGPPPDFRTGWSADGAPGRGSLNEFGFGAVMQHFTRSMDRVAGVDFRIPTQAELDALEAFQLFSGRQRNPQTASITFRDQRAENGKNRFLGPCVACHRDVVNQSSNLMFDTDIERLVTLGPRDGGFGVTGTDTQGGIGTGRFNVPPLVEAADTGPFFHNNTVATIEDAVAFYSSDVFFSSPGAQFSGPINFTRPESDEIAAYLRVINAAENIRQVRKRATFVQTHRGAGNSDILRVAIADTADAIADLAPRNLNPTSVHALRTLQVTLEIALANPDAQRPAFLANAQVWLQLARADLFVANPLNEF